jgi:hypothetical protein
MLKRLLNMDVNTLALPIALAARLTEFRKEFAAMQKMLTEHSQKYPLPAVLRNA